MASVDEHLNRARDLLSQAEIDVAGAQDVDRMELVNYRVLSSIAESLIAIGENLEREAQKQWD